MKTLTKKTLLASCVISILIIFVITYIASEIKISDITNQSSLLSAVPYVPLSGEGEIFTGSDSTDLVSVLNSIFKWSIAIILVLATIFILLGSIQYMTTDAVFDKSEGKTKITSAIAGLVLALTSWIILYTIDPNLLKMDIGGENTSNDSVPAPFVPFTGEEAAVVRDAVDNINSDSWNPTGMTPTLEVDLDNPQEEVRIDYFITTNLLGPPNIQ